MLINYRERKWWDFNSSKIIAFRSLIQSLRLRAILKKKPDKDFTIKEDCINLHKEPTMKLSWTSPFKLEISQTSSMKLKLYLTSDSSNNQRGLSCHVLSATTALWEFMSLNCMRWTINSNQRGSFPISFMRLTYNRRKPLWWRGTQAASPKVSIILRW